MTPGPSRFEVAWGAACWATAAWYVAVFAQLTIWAGDTDLWYHLSGGLFTATHGAPPDHTYFSFIEPPRPWVDYYWLFQWLVYRVHEAWGYPGLVALRTALVGAFAAVAVVACAPAEPGGRRAVRLSQLVLVSAVLLAAAGRYQLLRPHGFSYLAILALCWLFRVRGTGALIAPLVALAWVNLHGIYYPVLLLICLSYLAQYLWERRQRPFEPRRDAPYLAAIGLSLAAVLATPHGAALVPVPFVSTGFAVDYISELRRLDPAEFLSLGVHGLVPTRHTLMAAVGALALGALGRGMWRRDLAVAPVLLFFGGLALLARSGRFGVEFVLLSVPLLAAALSKGSLCGRGAEGPRRALAVAALAGLTLVHASAGRAVLDAGSGRFPLSSEGLPVGAVTFLREVGGGGKVLNHHNTGGYVRWELHPQYRIFMDMEVPFAFDDGDMFASMNVWSNEAVFSSVVARYRPEYLLVPRGAQGFRAIVAKHPRYRAVHLDDVEAVFADREQRPEVVARYELTALDPFGLEGRGLESLITGAGAERVAVEARQLVAFHPGSAVGNQILALLAKRAEDYEEMEARAAAIAEEYPKSALGYQLRGDALRLAGEPAQALDWYRKAVARSSGVRQRAVWVEMATCHETLGESEQAYAYLAKGVTPHAPETTPRDLYLRGAAAAMTGRVDEALALFQWSLLKTPDADAEHRARVERSLTAFGVPVE